MKNKKLILILIIILITIGIITFVVIGGKNNNENDGEEMLEEYTPQEEISREQMRETIITLYFLNTETKELKSEGKLIDATELIENPYKRIVEFLIELK